MSRKSRERMMRGRFELKTGETAYGTALKVPTEEKFGPLTPKKRARLLEYMRTVPETDREGVREYLRKDGSARALALLGEFEEKWAATSPGQQPGTEEGT